MPPPDEDADTSPPGPNADDLLHCNVLEGNVGVLSECEDSLEFLQLLANLAKPPSAKETASELPEKRAAKSLFRPEVIIITYHYLQD